MKIKFLKWFIAFAMFLSFFSCSKFEKVEEKGSILQIIGEMSLREKVCQMFILRPESLVCPEDPQSLDVTQLTEDMVDFSVIIPQVDSAFMRKISSIRYNSQSSPKPCIHFRPALCCASMRKAAV